jgi:hypothetical protein
MGNSFIRGMVMLLTDYRIAFVLLIGILYVLFDIWMKREIPIVFGLLTLGFGLFMAILFFNALAYISLLIMIGILVLGLYFNRLNFLGWGDTIMLASVSLIMPLLFGIPFIVFILITAYGFFLIMRAHLTKKEMKDFPFTVALCAGIVLPLLLLIK